jgi:hypothetical protein
MQTHGSAQTQVTDDPRSVIFIASSMGAYMHVIRLISVDVDPSNKRSAFSNGFDGAVLRLDAVQIRIELLRVKRHV